MSRSTLTNSRELRWPYLHHRIRACAASRINGLAVAGRRFGLVVPTLGISWKRRVGFDWAHVPAPHDDPEGREGPPLLAAGAERARRAAHHSADDSAAWRAR